MNQVNFLTLFQDKVALNYILYNYKKYLFKCYGIVVIRNGKKQLILLPDANNKTVIEILGEKKELSIISSDNGTEYHYKLTNEGSNYYLDDKSVDINKLREYLEEGALITEKIGFDQSVRKTITITRDDQTFGNNIANEDVTIRKKLVEIGHVFSTVDIMTFDIFINGSDFKIYKITVSDQTIKETIHFKSVIKKYMDVILKKYGWEGYMYRAWLKGLIQDHYYKGTTRREKRWAHKRGFYSYRIEQYGLTDNNYKEFLSDRDYKWLRKINNKYSSWMRDKLRFYYVFGKYAECLPNYYYRLSDGMVYCFDKPHSSQNIIDIVKLLQQKHILAMKPIKSSHGIGFYKLEYLEGAYYLNDKMYEEEKLIDFLRSIKDDYIITEYVRVHPMLENIYHLSSSTIRVMVINTDGNNPVIAHAYLRLGSKMSGPVDNLNRGGISVQLNHLTGEIISAEILKDHKYETIEVHPDTGARIEGVIPHWDRMCNKIKEISLYISPIEYLGFDVVVSENGFKILEVNMHQELHKYPDYSHFVKEYFEKKKTIKRSGKRLC